MFIILVVFFFSFVCYWLLIKRNFVATTIIISLSIRNMINDVLFIKTNSIIFIWEKGSCIVCICVLLVAFASSQSCQRYQVWKEEKKKCISSSNHASLVKDKNNLVNMASSKCQIVIASEDRERHFRPHRFFFSLLYFEFCQI